MKYGALILEDVFEYNISNNKGYRYLFNINNNFSFYLVYSFAK